MIVKSTLNTNEPTLSWLSETEWNQQPVDNAFLPAVSKTTAGAHASTQPQENIVKAAAIYWYDVFDRFRIGLSQPKIAKLFLREHLQDPPNFEGTFEPNHWPTKSPNSLMLKLLFLSIFNDLYLYTYIYLFIYIYIIPPLLRFLLQKS